MGLLSGLWGGKDYNSLKGGDRKPLRTKTGPSELHLGHIISQHWCKALQFDNNFIHHPYNLYLSCYSCNEALHHHFPSKKLQDTLNDDKATIGDWIYSSDAAIRATTP